MKIYVSSDWHFSHTKIIKYCQRPKDYETRIIKGFKVLKPDDILIFLGDICIGNDKEIHENIMQWIPCKKILVLGRSHDKKSFTFYMKYWDFVCDEFRLKIYGKRIVFSHVPIIWDGNWEINVHGHLHNVRGIESITHSNFRRLVALEYTDYQLVPLRSLIENGK